MSKFLSAKHVPIVLLISLLWFAGSTWWYVCETQGLCDEQEATTSQVTTPEPAVEEDVIEEPELPSFDTTRTLTAFFESDASTFTDREWAVELQEFADYLIANPEDTATVAGFTSFVGCLLYTSPSPRDRG